MKNLYDKIKSSTPHPERLVNLKMRIATWSFIAGICFGLLGMLIIPYGIIDGSVLILIAQLLVLTGTLLGKNITIDLEHKYFNTADKQSESSEAVKQDAPDVPENAQAKTEDKY